MRDAALGSTLTWALVLALLAAPSSTAAAPTAASTSAASSSPAAAAPLRDDRGVAIRLAVPPRRIVSLLPSLTESLCALGACARLVGVDRFSNWPPRVRDLPRLGDLDDAPIERIVALHPDLVVVASAARIVERLEGLGLTVVVLDSRNHADVRRTLRLLARLLDDEAAGERAWAGIEAQTREAAARVPAAWRGKHVYFEVDATPYGAGPGSFIGETLTRLGLSNALAAELGPFPKLNPEAVVRLQPDVVMAARTAVATMPQRPGWSALHALRDARTCAFAPDRYELLVRPGPRMGEAAGIIADCLRTLPTR